MTELTDNLTVVSSEEPRTPILDFGYYKETGRNRRKREPRKVVNPETIEDHVSEPRAHLPLRGISTLDTVNNPYSTTPPEGGYDTTIYPIDAAWSLASDTDIIRRDYILGETVAELAFYFLQSCRTRDRTYSVSYLTRLISREMGYSRPPVSIARMFRQMTLQGVTRYRTSRKGNDRIQLREEHRFSDPRNEILKKVMASYTTSMVS